MSNPTKIIEDLFIFSKDIRYAAIYKDNELYFKQKENKADSSGSESDRYEELLVNPAILKLATQRGNIDCGGLEKIIIQYGSFYQLIKNINGGHISICLSKTADINSAPVIILNHIQQHYPEYFDKM